MIVRAYPTCLLLSLALPLACATDDPAPAEGDTEAAETTGAGGSEGSESSDTAGESSSGATADVSYYEDVRPLLAQHCVSCHTDGSIAPFRLDTYEDVAGLAPAIKVVIEARTMPPYGVRADGSCQDYDEPRWLTDEEIATISAWVEGGMAAGDDTIEAP
ncbi:MAG: hypothetical protein KUG77_15980, partial [Nannocystaceae bacterium]|nr:hypothetical protein [Nannocystaceae bacterium]